MTTFAVLDLWLLNLYKVYGGAALLWSVPSLPPSLALLNQFSCSIFSYPMQRYESIAGQSSSSPSVRSYTVPIASGRPTLNTKGTIILYRALVLLWITPVMLWSIYTSLSISPLPPLSESALSLDRSLELTSSSPAVNRRKPIPPPKPSPNQWANIEQYLRTKGQLPCSASKNFWIEH